jgi:hypothetical protein
LNSPAAAARESSGRVWARQLRPERPPSPQPRAEVNPQYADAHFNLALLSERMYDNLKAVHHWKCYLKLDNTGQWAEIARRQLDRLRQATVIQSR